MVGKIFMIGIDKVGFFIFVLFFRWVDDDKYVLCDFIKYVGVVIGVLGI